MPGSSNGNNILDRNQANSQIPIFNGNNQLANQPIIPSNVQNSDQQIFVLCSLLATSLFFLILLILFILFKQRKRYFKNKNKATILQLDKLGSEEQQQMLLLMQQQTQTSSLNRANPPAQILISSNNRGYLQQPPSTMNQQTEHSEKMHLITRIDQTGSMIDHLLVRNNDNLQQSNNKRISPLNTMNTMNGNLPVLQHQRAISNSNVSSSLTTASVNSNPSHNSSADEEHQMNILTNHQTPKYNQRNHFDTTKSNSMFSSKFNCNGNLTNKFSQNKYLIHNQHLRQDSNYAFKIEEPDYAEPTFLQSLQSSVGDLEKYGNSNTNTDLVTNNSNIKSQIHSQECKQSINSQSNSSNRSPSDSDNYDNYEQFEPYEQQYDQYYDKCENTNYLLSNKTETYKMNNAQYKDFIETDHLLNNDDQPNDYDSIDQRTNLPPLPKTLPPSSYKMQQHYSKRPNQTLNYSTDAYNTSQNSSINLMSHHTPSKKPNHFVSSSNHLTTNNGFYKNSNRKMQFQTVSKLSSTNGTTNNSTPSSNSNSLNKFIEVS